MAEIIQQAQEALSVCKKETSEAEAKLNETKEMVEYIKSLELDVDLSYPKTTDTLAVIKDNVALMAEFADKIAAPIEKAIEVRQNIKAAMDLEADIEECLRNISYLDRSRRYTRALMQCENLAKLASTELNGGPFRFQTIASEIALWTSCSIRVHWAEDNIRANRAPFELEEFKQFEEDVANLPIGVHAEAQKEVFLDRLNGYRAMIRVKENIEKGDDYGELVRSLNLIDSISCSATKNSPLTKKRVRYLYLVTSVEYDRMCKDAFDIRREYKDAKDLFVLRDRFSSEDVRHPDFKEAKDERDFHTRFLDQEAERMDDESFDIAVTAYADSIDDPNEVELEALARYIGIESLSDEKKADLWEAVGKLDFESKIYLLAYAVKFGYCEEIQTRIWNLAKACKNKEFDLEKGANMLAICRDNIAEPLQNPFLLLLEDLLRSPHARKVGTKSVFGSVHDLYGEDKSQFPLPWGKPVEDTRVVPWSFRKKTLYIFFGVILPIILLLAGATVIYALLLDKVYGKYLLLAPFILIYLVMHFAIIARYGRDERGSAVWRRWMFVFAIIFTAIAILYFLLPNVLPVFRQVAFVSFILGLITGVWALFAYKDRKKWILFTLCFLWAFVIGAGISLLVLTINAGGLQLP